MILSAVKVFRKILHDILSLQLLLYNSGIRKQYCVIQRRLNLEIFLYDVPHNLPSKVSF